MPLIFKNALAKKMVADAAAAAPIERSEMIRQEYNKMGVASPPLDVLKIQQVIQGSRPDMAWQDVADLSYTVISLGYPTVGDELARTAHAMHAALILAPKVVDDPKTSKSLKKGDI